MILSQIPGINYLTAKTILKTYNGNFRLFYLEFIKSNGKILDGLMNENGRKISKTAIENIKKYIL